MALIPQGKENPIFVTFVYLALRFMVLFTMIAQCFNRNFENVFLCILTLLLFTLPSYFQRKWNVELPNALEVIILLFIFAAAMLGEIQSYYLTYPHWDLILHTINGFLCAAVGFSLVDLCNRDQHCSLSLSPLYMSLVAFCFSMTVGVLWEFFELFMDEVLGFDMQKGSVVSHIRSVALSPSQEVVTLEDITEVWVLSQGEMIALGVGGYLDLGLLDTMEDLIVNFVGALVFSWLGYFYVKNRGDNALAKSFIPRVLEERASHTPAQLKKRGE